MEYMRQVVVNLNNRLDEIDKKVKGVDTLLSDQNNNIRKQVLVVKEHWMSQF